MNLYQAANLGLSATVIAGVVGGLTGLFGAHAADGDAIHIVAANGVTLGLLLFILLLRLKMTLDDHKHFGEAVQLKLGIRIVGFVLAVLTALFLAVAAYQIAEPVNSAELAIIAILISTAWIAVHLIEISLDKKRRNAEAFIAVMREKWVLINVFYCLFLAAFIGWFPAIVPAQHAAPVYLMYLLLAFDWLTSRQLRPAA